MLSPAEFDFLVKVIKVKSAELGLEPKEGKTADEAALEFAEHVTEQIDHCPSCVMAAAVTALYQTALFPSDNGPEQLSKMLGADPPSLN